MRRGVAIMCIPWFEMGQEPPGFADVGRCGVQ
jgi:hypothetical protein